MAGLGLSVCACLVCHEELAPLQAQLSRLTGWVLVAMLLELARVGAEMLSTRAVLGAHFEQVSFATWLRSQLLCCGLSMLMPAGRAVGEAAKAAALGSAVPTAVAAATGAAGQIMTLLVNGCFGVLAALFALRLRDGGSFALVCLAYGGAFLLLGVALASAVRSSALATRLGRIKLIGGWSRTLLDAARHTHGVGLRALWPLLAGRAVQVLQFAVLLFGLAHARPMQDAPILQAIYTLGAAAGDLMPAQLGAVDAALALGHTLLGMTQTDLVALALALHVVQVSIALLCCAGAAALSQPFGERSGANARRQAWEI